MSSITKLSIDGSEYLANSVIKNISIDGIVYSIGNNTDDATATSTDILLGKTAYVNGEKIEGIIPSKSAQIYTPKTTDQTIVAGQYLSGTQTIKGDSNLKAINILSGKTIFGVSGSLSVIAAGGGFGTTNNMVGSCGDILTQAFQNNGYGYAYSGTPVYAVACLSGAGTLTIGGKTITGPGIFTWTSFSDKNVKYTGKSSNTSHVYAVLGTS